MMSTRLMTMRTMHAPSLLFVAAAALVLTGCEARPDSVPPGPPDPRDTLSDPATYPLVPRVVGDPTQPRPTDPSPDFTTRAERVRERTVVLTTYGSSSCPAVVADAFVVADENLTWVEVENTTYTDQRPCTMDMGPYSTEFDIPAQAPMPTEVRNSEWEQPVPIVTLRVAK